MSTDALLYIRRVHQARLPGCVLCGTPAACGFTGVAAADMITFGGAITQSTQGTGNPAQNNLTLNRIFDGDPYTVVLNFNGSTSSPGTYTNFVPPNPCLTATAACFSDPTRMATETSFGVISLTITANQDGMHDDFSLLGCLTTGGGCSVGNQLDANFEILAANLRSPNALAVGWTSPIGWIFWKTMESPISTAPLPVAFTRPPVPYPNLPHNIDPPIFGVQLPADVFTELAADLEATKKMLPSVEKQGPQAVFHETVSPNSGE